MAPATGTQSGLSENVAGLLCYVLGWVTGLIFYFIDKRPFVRFHAAQSIVVFGGLTIIRIVLSMLFVFRRSDDYPHRAFHAVCRRRSGGAFCWIRAPHPRLNTRRGPLDSAHD